MKKYKVIIFRLIFLLMSNLILTNLNSQSLEEYEWKNRVIIIYTDQETSAPFKAQIQEFSNLEKEFKDRKLVVYQIIDGQYKVKNYLLNEQDESWKKSVDLFDSLIDEKDTFKVILIGLDGGVKLKKSILLKKEELFALIDSMPMRRAELSNRKG